MNSGSVGPTCYEVLQVHPAAPLDLITAAYWRLIDLAQKALTSNEERAAATHRLTKAYQTLADPGRRATFDLSIGVAADQPVPTPRKPSSWPGRLFGWSHGTTSHTKVDHHEVLRVDQQASSFILAVAYDVMHDYYLRLVSLGQAQPELLDLLDEAYAVTADPGRHEQYDAQQRKRSAPRPTARGAQLHSRKVRPPGGALGRGALRTAQRAALAAAVALARLLKRTAVHAGPSIRVALRAVLNLSLISGQAAARAGHMTMTRFREAAHKLADFLSSRRSESGHKPDREQEDIPSERLSLSALALSAGHSTEVRAQAQLVLVGGPEAVKEYRLNGRPLTLGSEEGSDIMLPGMAPRQARLWYREDRFVIYNLADGHTTLVNDRPVVWAVLEEGDEIQLGTCRLVFRRFASNLTILVPNFTPSTTPTLQ